MSQSKICSTVHSIMVFISESFTSNSSRKVHVFAHHSNSTSMECAEVDIFEESDDISFSSFLEGSKGGGLESEFVVVSLSQWSNKSLEGKSLHQASGWSLVSLDFSHSNCTRSPSMLLSDNTTLGRGVLSSSLSFWFSSALSFSSLGFFGHRFSSCHFSCVYCNLKFKFQKSAFSCLYHVNSNSNGFKGYLNFFKRILTTN